MKKKRILLISCLAVVLSSCLFESDDVGLSGWLSDQGLPDAYTVQTLSIDGLMPTKASVYRNTTPQITTSRTVLGNASKLSHEIALDFNYESDSDLIDSAYVEKFGNAEKAEAHLRLYCELEFYKNKNIADIVTPVNDEVKLNISWKLSKGKRNKFIDSVADIPDSIWTKSLMDWNPDVSFDTVTTIKVRAKDTVAAVFFDLPKSIIAGLIDCNKGCRLEMRVAAPEAKNLYRFYAVSYDEAFVPVLRAQSIADGDTMSISLPVFRMADVVVDNDCSDCLVLHGGVIDSLVAEIPSAPVMKALSEFYGDEFPYSGGDGYDVRQAVVLAQLTFARDDGASENQLGFPLKVWSYTFQDSNGKEFRSMESYKLNDSLVKNEGHPDMVFYDGDSLTLQVTEGTRYFINRAHDDAKLKFMMRLSKPQLQDRSYRDTVYKWILECDSIDGKRVCDTLDPKASTKGKKTTTVYDTSTVFLDHIDYARYDFSEMMKKPATLKLWLATKRRDE